MIDPRYHHRQMLVAEIGTDGQRRIASSCAAVDGIGLAHQIATRYATLAGFGSVVTGGIDEQKLVPSFVQTRGATSVLAGARASVVALRKALAGDGLAGDAPGDAGARRRP